MRLIDHLGQHDREVCGLPAYQPSPIPCPGCRAEEQLRQAIIEHLHRHRQASSAAMSEALEVPHRFILEAMLQVDGSVHPSFSIAGDVWQLNQTLLPPREKPNRRGRQGRR